MVLPLTEEVSNPRSFRTAELSPKPGSLTADLRFTSYKQNPISKSDVEIFRKETSLGRLFEFEI